MNDLLLFLLKKGAHRTAINISTSELGSALDMSQQNASRLLIELERQEKIKRIGSGIMITKKGLEEIKDIYAELKQSLEGDRLQIKGKIIEGLGEGGFYVSLQGYKKQFKEKLGFEPFPGTLNIKLDKNEIEKRYRLRELDPIIIEGWHDEKRSYGDLFAYKCKLDNLDAAVVLPVRTHHGLDIIELVAPFNIKQKLRKKNEDVLTVRII